MGRHEIKLRRHKMTSRRIEGYKDYNALLAEHKSVRFKRLIKLIILLLFFFSLITFTYIAITSKEIKSETHQDNQEKVSSRPDVLINVNLNTVNDGKT